MDENINTAETVETAAEEVQTTPTGEAAEVENATPEENAETSTDTDIDVDIDIENEYVSDGKPDKVFEQRAKAKGMTTAEYAEYVTRLECEAEIARLMNEEGMTRQEAEREARYQIQDKQLKAREEQDRRKDRYVAEMREFKELYPEVDKKKIPQSVWDEVARGVDLSSAYAKYERKQSLAKAKADKANVANARAAVPKIRDDQKTEKIFTMEEMKNMSPVEVKRNYEAILRSLNQR